MSALNFPSSPSTNQIYTANGKSWRFDGTSWKTYYILGVQGGGTGNTFYNLGDILVGAGTSLYPLPIGSNNYVLTADNTAPFGISWKVAASTGITSLNSLTQSIQYFSIGSSGTGFNISSSGSTHTFNIPIAGSGSTGLITTLAQTIAGQKTFTSAIIGDLIGTATTASFASTANYAYQSGYAITSGFATTSSNIYLTSASTNSTHPLIFAPSISNTGVGLSANNLLSYNPYSNILYVSGLAVTASTISNSTSSGALVVTGGVGIGGSLFVTSSLPSNISGIVLNNSVITTGSWAGSLITAFYGGTGYNSYSKGDILVGAGNTFIKLSVGTDNYVLTASSSSSTGLTWSPTAATGITTLNSLTATQQYFAVGTSGNLFNISSSGSTHTFNIPLAGSGSTGLISTQAQTIAGQKTFTSTIIGDLSGTATTAQNLYVNNAITNLAHPLHFSPVATGSGVAVSSNTAISFNPSNLILSTSGLAVTATTASISTSTGALIISGGVGIGGSLYTLSSVNSLISGVNFLNGIITSGTWAGSTITSFYGGTGYQTYTTGDLLAGAGSTLLKIAVGTNNFVLLADSTVPGGVRWANVSGIAITNINGLTSSKQDLAFGYSGTVPAFSSSGTTHTLNIPLAGTGSTGLVSTQSQSFSGIKTFTNDVIISSSTISNSSTTGALTITGGVGIGGSLFLTSSLPSSLSGVVVNNGVVTSGSWAGSLITAFYGGTGYNSYTKGDILVGAGNTFIKLAVGTDSYVLTASSSTASGLTWSPTAATGITTLNSLTATQQYFAVGTSGSTFNISSSGSTHTFNIPLTGTGITGLVSPDAQTIAGQKTFTSAIIGSLTGTATTAQNLNVNNAATNSAHFVHFSPVAVGSGVAVSSNTTVSFNPSTLILSTSGLAVTANTGSISTSTGALTITGGVGIGGSLFVSNSVPSSISNVVINNGVVTSGSWAGSTITSFYGGTGFQTYSTGDLLAGAGSTLVKVAVGTNNYVLIADSTVPGGIKWGNVSGIAITNINGLTSSKQDLAFGYSGTVPAFSSSGNTHTLNIPIAGTGSTGLITSQAQTFGGVKTFANEVVISSSLASTTFNTGALVIAGGVGIGGSLNVQGDLNVLGTFTTINSTTVTVADKNIELGVVSSPSDLTAQGGGITLKGATDKSINWYSGTGWSSSESWNLAANNTYKINNSVVLSSSSLGTGITNSYLTAVGTISTGIWSATAITALYGGTGLVPSFTVGDLLYANTANTWARLTASSNSGYLLASAGSGATPTYIAPSTLSVGTATTASNINIANASSGVFYPVLSSTLASNSGFGLSANTYFSFNASTGAFAATSINISSSQAYSIGGNSVLSATSLGIGVTNSYLTAVGTITTGVWAGTLITAYYGGTGYNSYTKGDILVGAGNTFIKLGVGQDSYILTASSTSSTGLSWSPPAASSATGITTLNSLTSTQQYFSTGTSGTGFNISSSGSTHTFNIPIAGTGATGLVTGIAQTFGGAKTFINDVIISSTTGSTAYNTGALTVYGGLGVSGQLSFVQASLGYTGASNPSMAFIGSTNSAPITLTVLSDNSLIWEGSSGKLFGINNNLSSGWIFNVGDISGLPIIRANADGTIAMAEFAANVGIGLSNPSYKLHVAGDTNLSATYVYRINGVQVLSSSTLGTGVTNSSLTSVGVINSGTWAATAITAFYGGTGYSSYTVGDLLVGAGSTLYKLPVGTNNYVLTADNTAPGGIKWSVAASTGVTTINAITTSIQYFSTGTSGSGFNISSSGSTHTFNIPIAGTGSTGLVSTLAQSFAGVKTFTNDTVISSSTVSTSTSTGALTITGGVGIGGSLFTGTSTADSISGVVLNNGVITSGSWSATAITAKYGGTGNTTYTLGDLLVGAGNTFIKLPVGINGYLLGADSAQPSGVGWTTVTPLTVSTSAPPNPKNADLWFNSFDGSLLVYYKDTDTSQWVEIALGSGIDLSQPVHITDTTASTSTSTGALIVNGGVGILGELHTSSLVINGTYDVVGTSITLSTTATNQVIYTLDASIYRSVKFMVQVTRGTDYQVQEILLLQDGIDTFLTQYAQLLSSNNLVLTTYDADLNSGNIRLLVTPTYANTTYKIYGTAVRL